MKKAPTPFLLVWMLW